MRYILEGVIHNNRFPFKKIDCRTTPLVFFFFFSINITQLLQSENSGVRNRALRQLLIELQINPIQSFSYFENFPTNLIHDYFNGKNENKLIISSIIPKVINSTEKYIEEIPLNLRIHLFHFFIQCLNNCIMVLEQPKDPNNLIFYPNTYFSILEHIFSKNPNEIFENLTSEEIFILLKNEVGKSYFSNMIDKIVDLIVKEPNEYCENLIFLVENNLSNPIPFQCIQKLRNDHKELFFKYFHKYQNFLRLNFPQELKNMSVEESPNELSSKYFDDVIGVTKSAQYNPYYGYFTDQSQNLLYKITNNPEQDAENIANLIQPNSNYQLLTQNPKIKTNLPSLQDDSNNGQTADNDIILRRRGSSLSSQKKKLASYGEKKGGLGHKSWQKRFLEFYPHNNCIVWKEELNSKEIKGVLILTKTATISFKTKTTGHLYKIIINPGEKQKNYEISFDTEPVAKEWFTSLKAACQQIKQNST